MGNTAHKDSLFNFNKNSSNVSFTLNNNSILIPFISKSINEILVNNLNKSTNLSSQIPYHIPLTNSSILPQQLKYSQMATDIADSNIKGGVLPETEKDITIYEEILEKYSLSLTSSNYNNGIYNKKVSRESSSNSSFNANTSLNSLSSIHNSGGAGSRPDSANELIYTSHSTTIKGDSNKISPNTSTKQVRTIKIGRKEGFTLAGSKEKNEPHANNSNKNKNVIEIPRTTSYKKKAISPPRNKKSIGNVNIVPFQKKENPNNLSMDNTCKLNTSVYQEKKSTIVGTIKKEEPKKNKNFIPIEVVPKKALSPPGRVTMGKVSNVSNNSNAFIGYYNLPKSLSPTQSASTNYSTVSSVIGNNGNTNPKPKDGGGSYVNLIRKRKERESVVGRGNLSLDNIKTKSKSKSKSKEKSKSKSKEKEKSKEKKSLIEDKNENNIEDTQKGRKSKPKMIFALDLSNLDEDEGNESFERNKPKKQKTVQIKRNKDFSPEIEKQDTTSKKIMNRIVVKIEKGSNSQSPPQKVYKNIEKLEKLKNLKKTHKQQEKISLPNNPNNYSVFNDLDNHRFQSASLNQIYNSMSKNQIEHKYTSNTYTNNIEDEQNQNLDVINEEDNRSRSNSKDTPSGNSTSRFSFNKKSTPKFEKNDTDTASITSQPRKINFKITTKIDENEFNDVDFLN